VAPPPDPQAVPPARAGGPQSAGPLGGIDTEQFDSAGAMRTLGIKTVLARADRVVLRLPVTERVHQPYGILHGGVSALLAETAASYGGALSAPEGCSVVGIELNASHLRPMREGTLHAEATPVRLGRAIQVWEVRLTDDAGRDICRARCTLAVIATTGGSRRSSG
jgi:1,4-dihydroxy-2-naphthoyl-CoA hydrolase